MSRIFPFQLKTKGKLFLSHNRVICYHYKHLLKISFVYLCPIYHVSAYHILLLGSNVKVFIERNLFPGLNVLFFLTKGYHYPTVFRPS